MPLKKINGATGPSLKINMFREKRMTHVTHENGVLCLVFFDICCGLGFLLLERGHGSARLCPPFGSNPTLLQVQSMLWFLSRYIKQERDWTQLGPFDPTGIVAEHAYYDRFCWPVPLDSSSQVWEKQKTSGSSTHCPLGHAKGHHTWSHHWFFGRWQHGAFLWPTRTTLGWNPTLFQSPCFSMGERPWHATLHWYNFYGQAGPAKTQTLANAWAWYADQSG